MERKNPVAVGIDDSKAILTVLGGICREQGVEFQGTSEWSEIIKIVTIFRVSSSVLFISDFEMRDHGGVNGDCVVKSVRRVFPDLPVILYSASPERVTGLVSEMKSQYPEAPIAVVPKPGKERMAQLLASFRRTVLLNEKFMFE